MNKLVAYSRYMKKKKKNSLKTKKNAYFRPFSVKEPRYFRKRFSPKGGIPFTSQAKKRHSDDFELRSPVISENGLAKKGYTLTPPS